MKYINSLSPNFEERPSDAVIDMLVIHHTEMNSFEEAIDIMLERGVSSHYLIAENGDVHRIVLEEKKAWHAGPSYWRGRDSLNNYSIGIELDNPGDKPFAAAQMESLIILCKEIVSRHQIPAYNIVGHSDIAPSRKVDPSHYFNWQMLADRGIGLYPKDIPNDNTTLAEEGEQGEIVVTMQEMLKSFGYSQEVTGIFDQNTSYVVQAFKRHYNQAQMDNIWRTCDHLILQELLSF
jgi:N-acetylmuramoyl-L-alanine amidase